MLVHISFSFFFFLQLKQGVKDTVHTLEEQREFFQELIELAQKSEGNRLFLFFFPKHFEIFLSRLCVFLSKSIILCCKNIFLVFELH